MTCDKCSIAYLIEKTAMLETIIRRVSNNMTNSAVSAEVLAAQQKNAKDLKSFGEKWNANTCPHQTFRDEITLETVGATPPPFDYGSGVTQDGIILERHASVADVSPVKRRPGRPPLPKPVS